MDWCITISSGKIYRPFQEHFARITDNHCEISSNLRLTAGSTWGPKRRCSRLTPQTELPQTSRVRPSGRGLAKDVLLQRVCSCRGGRTGWREAEPQQEQLTSPARADKLKNISQDTRFYMKCIYAMFDKSFFTIFFIKLLSILSNPSSELWTL